MCECVAKVNEMLAESNTMLDECCMLNLKGGMTRNSLVIATMRLDQSKKRTKVRRVIPSYCPFCGEKIKTTSELAAKLNPAEDF